MSLLLQNLRHASRALRFQPAFSSLAILTLALGIGATTAVFTAVYGVLLRPLPYRDPGRLVMLLYGHQGTTSPWYSPLNYRDYATQNDAFSGTAAYTPVTANMTAIRSHFTPERIQVRRGDTVVLNIANVEQTYDATHGFAIPEYNINLSLEPGETETVRFVADRAGVFPYYCTEFCSALHLEMAGYLLVED